MWSHAEVLAPLRQRFEERGHDVHVPTLPGHDPEDPWEPEQIGNTSITEYFEFLTGYIRSLQLNSPPVLVGHSMGGLLAQMIASAHETGPVVLFNSAGPAGVNHINPTAARATLNVLTTPFFWKKPHKPSFSRACYGLLNQMEPHLSEEVYSQLVPESGRAMFELVFWFLDGKKVTRIDSDRIKAPMLIVHGERDRITPTSVARALQRLYPGAEVHSYADHGHWICHEPFATNTIDRLIDWIETHANSRSTRISDDTGALPGRV